MGWLAQGELWAAPLSDAAKKTISANENYLKRFRKEREALNGLTDAESAKKAAALDKKIQNLEKENARLSGSTQQASSSSTPVSPKTSAPAKTGGSVPAPPSIPAPVPSAASGSAVAEWETLNREQKEAYVQNIVDGLKKEGRIIERHPLFYTALMDYVFVSNAELASKPLREAVLATIDKNESKPV